MEGTLLVDAPVVHDPESPWMRQRATWEGTEQAGLVRRGGSFRLLKRVLLRRPVLIALSVLVAVAVATDVVRPSTAAGRAVDLKTFIAAEQNGVSSCAGGLHDSLTALDALLTGASQDYSTGAAISTSGAQACSPTSNGDLFDMATSVPPRTLDGYGLADANIRLYSWAYPLAARVSGDITAMISHHAPLASSQGRSLVRDLAALRAQGQLVQGMFDAAAGRLNTPAIPFTPTIVPAIPASLAP